MAATDARPPTRAYLGWIFELTNRKHNLHLNGAPRDILEQLAGVGGSPEIFKDVESEIKAAMFHADAVPGKFHGGPHAAGIIRILDALAARRYDEAVAVIQQDAQVLTGEHDGAAVPLNQFAAMGAVDAVKFLLEHGARVNRRHHLGVTALHWAAALGRLEVVDALLAHGADPAATTWFLLTPGQLAHANKHQQVANRLAEFNTEPLDGWKMLAVLKRMGCG